MNNFAFRTACKRCNTGMDGSEAPATPKGGNAFGGKPGDWICSQCSNDNFAFRTECKRCSAPKGDSEVVPGDRNSGGRGGFRGGRGSGGRGSGGFRGSRGAPRGGSGPRKSFGGFDGGNKSFENKSFESSNKKIKFDD